MQKTRDSIKRAVNKTVDAFKKAVLNERGHEIVSNKPVALPIDFKRPPTLAEQIRQMVKTELSQSASDQGMETFEEADDFDVGDDFDPQSPHEMVFDPASGEERFRDELTEFVEEIPSKPSETPPEEAPEASEQGNQAEQPPKVSDA